MNACLQEKLLDTVDLAQYAIRGTDADWEAATKRSKATQGGGSGTVSIKTKVRVDERELWKKDDGILWRCILYFVIFCFKKKEKGACRCCHVSMEE